MNIEGSPLAQFSPCSPTNRAWEHVWRLLLGSSTPHISSVKEKSLASGENVPFDKVTGAERRHREQWEQTDPCPARRSKWSWALWGGSVEARGTSLLLSPPHSVPPLGKDRSVRISPVEGCLDREPWARWSTQERNAKTRKGKSLGTHSSWPRQTYPRSRGRRRTPTLPRCSARLHSGAPLWGCSLEKRERPRGGREAPWQTLGAVRLTVPSEERLFRLSQQLPSPTHDRSAWSASHPHLWPTRYPHRDLTVTCLFVGWKPVQPSQDPLFGFLLFFVLLTFSFFSPTLPQILFCFSWYNPKNWIFSFFSFFIVVLHFPPISSPNPSHPHLPPSILPPLALSTCPLYMFLDGPSPLRCLHWLK